MLLSATWVVGVGKKENGHVEEEGCSFKYDYQEMFHCIGAI